MTKTYNKTILGEYKFIIISRVVNNVFVVVTIDGDKNSCTIVVDIHFSVSKMTFFTCFIHLNKKKSKVHLYF